jgi:hypothetical protein
LATATDPAARRLTRPETPSHDHLNDAEKELLDRCSAFTGGFNL